MSFGKCLSLPCIMLITVLASHASYSATIESKEDGQISIIGNIEAGDYDKLVDTVRNLNLSELEEVSLTLMSPGGDLLEAMKIGRFVRDNFLSVQATENFLCHDHNTLRKSYSWPEGAPMSTACACYSACFVIWSSGIRRYGGLNPWRNFPGRLGARPQETFVGIHRPTFEKEYFANLTAAQAESQYDRMVMRLPEITTVLRVKTPLKSMFGLNHHARTQTHV